MWYNNWMDDLDKKEQFGRKVIGEFKWEGKPAQIVRVEKGDIKDEELDVFIENLIGTNFKLEDIPNAAERMEIRDQVEDIRERLKEVSGPDKVTQLKGQIDAVRSRMGELGVELGDSSSLDQVKADIYPDHTRRDHIKGSKRSTLKMIENGQFFAIQQEGKTLSMQGARRLDGKIGGKEVLELTKGSTVKELQKKGLGGRLTMAIFAHVSKENPDAVWISMSRNTGLLAAIKARGGQVDDLDADTEPARYMREHNGDYWKVLHEQGYKVIFLDPKKF